VGKLTVGHVPKKEKYQAEMDEVNRVRQARNCGQSQQPGQKSGASYQKYHPQKEFVGITVCPNVVCVPKPANDH
jgi:hypothetical protein